MHVLSITYRFGQLLRENRGGLAEEGSELLVGEAVELAALSVAVEDRDLEASRGDLLAVLVLRLDRVPAELQGIGQRHLLCVASLYAIGEILGLSSHGDESVLVGDAAVVEDVEQLIVLGPVPHLGNE